MKLNILFSEHQKCRQAEDRTVHHLANCRAKPVFCGGTNNDQETKNQLIKTKTLLVELEKTESSIQNAFQEAGMGKLHLIKDAVPPPGLKAFKTGAFTPHPDDGKGCGEVAKCKLIYPYVSPFLKFPKKY